MSLSQNCPRKHFSFDAAVFHLSIKDYCKTRPHRSYSLFLMFKLRCKRHYRNLATYSWCTTWLEHVTKTPPARRRHSVGDGGAATAASETSLFVESHLPSKVALSSMSSHEICLSPRRDSVRGRSCLDVFKLTLRFFDDGIVIYFFNSDFNFFLWRVGIFSLFFLFCFYFS